jgi:hypothetical protein
VDVNTVDVTLEVDTTVVDAGNGEAVVTEGGVAGATNDIPPALRYPAKCACAWPGRYGVRYGFGGPTDIVPVPTGVIRPPTVANAGLPRAVARTDLRFAISFNFARIAAISASSALY